MSRNKGKSGEREAAKLLTKLLGKSFIRGAQHSGSPDSPDIKLEFGKTKLHGEVKRTESHVSLKLYDALEQANSDAGKSKIPFVMSRRNRRKWIIALEAENLIDFCREVMKLYEK